MKQHPVIWTASTIYVDIDTGEIITKHKANTEYIIIKKTKYAKITNYNRTKGHIEYTNQCRKQPQLQLFPTNQP